MSASTIWVLWCEPEAIRSQFFVLFRKYLQDNSKNEKSKKIIIIIIIIIIIKNKKKIKKIKIKIKNEAENSLLLGNVFSISYYKNRTTYSQGYLYG